MAYPLIISLRKFGSVEPVNPIINPAEMGKIDLSNGRLDGYTPNKVNAPKIMKELFAKYPLNETQINHEIEAFKQKDFAGLVNTVWALGKDEWTITEIIDELSSMRQVLDRLPEAFDFKKVLATIICVASTLGDQQMEHSLILTLHGLKMCELGKLLNLLHVVQDKVVKDIFVIRLEEAKCLFGKSLEDISQFNGPTQFLDNYININLWVQEVVLGHIPPEKWSISTCVLQGHLNKTFFEMSGNKKVTSGHYIALKDKYAPALVKIISSGNLQMNKAFLSWKEAYEAGQVVCFFRLTDKAIESLENMETLFDQVQISAKFNFGQFKAVKLQVIDVIYGHMLEKWPTHAVKFLELLKQTCSFENEAEKSLDQLVPLVGFRNDVIDFIAQGLRFEDFRYDMIKFLVQGLRLENLGKDVLSFLSQGFRHDDLRYDILKFVAQKLMLENIHNKYITGNLTNGDFINKMLLGILEKGKTLDITLEYLAESDYEVDNGENLCIYVMGDDETA